MDEIKREIELLRQETIELKKTINESVKIDGKMIEESLIDNIIAENDYIIGLLNSI